jgi:hypothetical protein
MTYPRKLATVTQRDPRYRWHEIGCLESEATEWIRGSCRHVEVVPVVSGGETVAHLCTTCNEQLPEEWPV